MSKSKQQAFPWSNVRHYDDPKEYAREEMERVYDWLMRYIDFRNQSPSESESGSDLEDRVTVNEGDILALETDVADLRANPVAAGADTQVQFNDGGLLAGDATFTFNEVLNLLTIQNLTITGELLRNIRLETSDYTVVAADSTILADATSNTVTITLAEAKDGKRITIKCIGDTFTCDINGGGDNIDGSATNFQIYDDESVEVEYETTTGWNII